MSPHGTSSHGIKRRRRLDFSQSILALLASLALERWTNHFNTWGQNFHPSTSLDRSRRSRHSPGGVHRNSSDHFRKPAESECHLTSTNCCRLRHIVDPGMRSARPGQRSRCRSSSVLIEFIEVVTRAEPNCAANTDASTDTSKPSFWASSLATDANTS